MDVSLRKCTISDLEVLCEFSKQNYYDAFIRLNTKENMDAYLAKAFDRQKLSAELHNKNSNFYFLYCDDHLAGYLKLNKAPAQTDINDVDSLEIERIYVAKEYQGKRLGQRLMDEAIKTAKQRGKKYVWLGVWQKNERALRFYQKNGFYEIGTHTFVMGDDVQTDYILRKDIT